MCDNNKGKSDISTKNYIYYCEIKLNELKCMVGEEKLLL